MNLSLPRVQIAAEELKFREKRMKYSCTDPSPTQLYSHTTQSYILKDLWRFCINLGKPKQI